MKILLGKKWEAILLVGFISQFRTPHFFRIFRHDYGNGRPLLVQRRQFVEQLPRVDRSAGARYGNDNFMHGNSLILMMQQRKYSKTLFWWPGTIFWRPGLFVAALAAVFFYGCKPVPAKAGGGVSGGSPIIWLSVEQAAGRLQQEKRPVLIDLYTNWCGWCKQMDKNTYSNRKVKQYLEDKFYTVKVDAETHAVISWKGITYQYNPQYRSNEFALYLTHGLLEFPTTIIIPPGQEPQAIPGYMGPKDLELLVKYFGEGAYKTQGFDVYQKSFRASW
jgi:thioredoxin-related protein